MARSAVLLSLATALVVVLLPPAPAAAAQCPGKSVGGEAVAWLTVEERRVPVKPIAFRAGGVLDPPASAKVAGISRAHARLDARAGTSVIAWHVRYGKGCPGSLNRLIKAPIGTEFEVEVKDGSIRTYRISDRVEVRKGRYRAKWFRQDGPHRLALFTCAKLRNGEFRNTVAVFADPVQPDQATLGR